MWGVGNIGMPIPNVGTRKVHLCRSKKKKCPDEIRSMRNTASLPKTPILKMGFPQRQLFYAGRAVHPYGFLSCSTWGDPKTHKGFSSRLRRETLLQRCFTALTHCTGSPTPYPLPPFYQPVLTQKFSFKLPFFD